MAIHIHNHDLPKNLDLGANIAIDTETMGLNPYRDRLCLVQLSSGDGNAHLVKIAHPRADTPHLKSLLADPTRAKLFHFARFDVLLLNIIIPNHGAFIALKSRQTVCTHTDRHGLRFEMNCCGSIYRSSSNHPTGAETALLTNRAICRRCVVPASNTSLTTPC